MGKENWCQIVKWEGKDLKVEAIRPGEWGKEKHRPCKNKVFWGGKVALGRDRGRKWLVYRQESAT